MESLNIGEFINESIKTIILQEIKNAKKEIEREVSRKEIIMLVQRGYPNELISTAEVRRRLNIGNEIMNDLIDLDLIPSLKYAKNRKVSSYDLDDFIEKYKWQDLSEVIEEAKNRREVI